MGNKYKYDRIWVFRHGDMKKNYNRGLLCHCDPFFATNCQENDWEHLRNSMNGE